MMKQTRKKKKALPKKVKKGQERVGKEKAVRRSAGTDPHMGRRSL